MHYDRSTPLDFTSEERLLIIVESWTDAINQGLERSFAPLKPWACLSVPPTTSIITRLLLHRDAAYEIF